MSMVLALTATAGRAAVLYTFSNTGASPYSFSLLELNPLTTTGAFAIAPFQAGGLTFTQADLSNFGGVQCFQFGTAGASLTAVAGSCGVSATAPDGGWQSIFLGAKAPGTYATFTNTSSGSAPAAPDRLTIRNVAATLYTFSNTGTSPYSFSFLELNPLTMTGAFAVAPFQAGGLTFTQADLSNFGGVQCFQFGTAGASLTAVAGSCGVSASAPDGGWQSIFLGAKAPGTYATFTNTSSGSAPAAPDQLKIVALTLPAAVPEPSGLVLILGGLAGLAASRRRRVY
jgi:hypothetical protein